MTSVNEKYKIVIKHADEDEGDVDINMFCFYSNEGKETYSVNKDKKNSKYLNFQNILHDKSNIRV
jgi:hypothetical protein